MWCWGWLVFKRLAILASLLSACGTQTSTPPRVVTFNDAFVGYAPIENDCDWQEVDISVFNQKDQRVSFRHRFCEDGANFVGADFEVSPEQRNWVMVTTHGPLKTGTLDGKDIIQMTDLRHPLFSIAKLGPLTPQDFLKQFEKNFTQQTESYCKISQKTEFLWQFTPHEKLPNIEEMQNLETKYSKNEAIDIVEKYSACLILQIQNFGIKDGLVIAYPAPTFDVKYVDPSSITYTNRG